MKNILFSIVLFILLSSSDVRSQYAQFDSVKILVSSETYEYKNPSYDKLSNPVNYFIKDCLLSYERWRGNETSDIAARFMTHNIISPEVILSDTGNISKNPSSGYFEYLPQNNEGIVVYQSNKFGNWDIFYSKYNGSTWGSAVRLTESSANETDPVVYVYRDFNVNNMLIIFLRNGDIFAKNFFNGSWLEEVNLTSDVTENCTLAKLLGGSMAYLINSGSDSTKIVYHRIKINSDGSIYRGSLQVIEHVNPESGLNTSTAYSGWALNYDFDTLGTTHCYSAMLYFNGYESFNNTFGIEGVNRSGTGSTHGDITDGIGHSVYTWLNKHNDSSYVYIKFSWTPKKFTIGDANFSSHLVASPKVVHSGANAFRIFVVWETLINGKTALVYSYGDGQLTDVNNVNSLMNGYMLHQNYPNPFNPTTKINYSLPNTQCTILKVYDILGNEIATLVNEKQNAGSYSVEFDAGNYPSGIYYYKLEAGDFSEVRKMILVK